MAFERQQRQGRPGHSEERDAQAGGEGETASHVAAKRPSREREAGGFSVPEGSLTPRDTFTQHAAAPVKPSVGLEHARARLHTGGRRVCSSSLQGAIEVRCLPPALAAVGPAGWKISVRRRKEGGLVPGAVSGGSVSSYLPSTAVPGLPEEPSACSGSGAVSIRVTFVPWSCFLHAQMVQSPHCPLVS